MFKSQYQGGSFVEVFSAQGRDPVSQWKLTGSVKKDYDKSLKGYVYRMEGGSSTTSTRMHLPKNEKLSLGLVQRYLVLQISVPSSGRLALELTVLDGAGCRRRVQLSSSLREVSASPLNARVPLSGVLLIDQWVNVCVDVVSLVTGLFKGQSFKSLEGVCIGGSCSLRRVFTLQSPPPDTTDHTHLDDVTTDEIPQSCQLRSSTISIQTQVLTYSRLTEAGSCNNSESCISRHVHSPSSSSSVSRPTHVAFGRKVAIPDHILSSRQSARTAPGTRQPSSVHQREGGLEGVGLQPRPPTGPADPSLLRIQKKRVRMLHSGGRGRGQAHQRARSHDIPSCHTQHEDTDHPDLTKDLTRLSSETSTVVKDSGYGTVESSDIIMTSSPQHDVHTSLPWIPVEGTGSEYPSLVNESLTSEQGEDESLDNEQELDQSTLQELLYSFHSLPKSASAGGKRESVDSHNISMDTSGRGATLEEDFVSPGNDHRGSSLDSSANEQGFPLISRDESAVVHPVVQNRLSDDYDWRLYTSREDEQELVESLRTRLAGGVAGGVAAMESTTTPHSNSSELEGTLSGSMTLSSGWTERYKNATHAPIYDSLDTRGMGGMLSPAMGTLTDQSDLSGEGGVDEGEELELMYDPQLNCYYDPVTYKYYELAQ